MTVPIYDNNNIFAKILRGELPSTQVFENDFAVCIKNIHPQAKIHLLIIPKNAYTDYQDFHENATDPEILGLHSAIKDVAIQEKINETGYRLVTNCRADSRQEIPHFHFHMMGGETLKSL